MIVMVCIGLGENFPSASDTPAALFLVFSPEVSVPYAGC